MSAKSTPSRDSDPKLDTCTCAHTSRIQQRHKKLTGVQVQAAGLSRDAVRSAGHQAVSHIACCSPSHRLHASCRKAVGSRTSVDSFLGLGFKEAAA